MATRSEAKFPKVLVPSRTAALSAIIVPVTADMFGATKPAAGDIIELFEIRPKVRIVGGLIRAAGATAAGGTLRLQAVMGEDVHELVSAPVAGDVDASTNIDRFVPSYADGDTMVRLLLAGGALDGDGMVEVVVLTDNP